MCGASISPTVIVAMALVERHVPSSKLTQRYAHVMNYTDLPEITTHQIRHFFEHYKDLEPGKWVKVEGWGGPADAAAEIVGEARVERNPPPCLGSEDFAFMLRERPGSYIWMGTGGSDDATEAAQLHSPHYDFNDAALGIGVSYWARLVERLLPKAA